MRVLLHQLFRDFVNTTTYRLGPQTSKRSRLLIGRSNYVASCSSLYEALFGAICGASELICPHIQRQWPAHKLWPMSSLFLLDVYGWAIVVVHLRLLDREIRGLSFIPDTDDIESFLSPTKCVILMTRCIQIFSVSKALRGQPV